jgi:repressor LexA
MLFKEILIQYEIDNNLSHEEMATKVGVSISTYYRWINGETTQLRKNTKIRVSKVLGINVDDILEESARFKPILGSVKAGYDSWAIEDIEGYIEVGNKEANKGDYFLRVKGNSMEGANIYSGDLVFVKQCNTLEQGKIGIVLIGDEATIKKVYFKNDLMILEAANPNVETKYFSQNEIKNLPVKILGKAIFLRRNLD